MMAKQQQKLYAVRVRIREVPHNVIEEDLIGNPSVVIKSGYGPGHPNNEPWTKLGFDVDENSQEFKDAAEDYKYGELIHLMERDYIRLKRANCVIDADDAENLPELDEELLNVHGASVEDLANWIRTEKPTANDVVQASDGSPDVARKLLEAESAANDGEPRQGVLKGLTAVIDRG
jgi:hypothetical protein